VADILQHLRLQILDILVPPVLVVWQSALPVLHLKLAELCCQVHQGYGYHLWFPLKAECCAQTVIYKCPGHLHHLLQLWLVTLQALGIFQKRGVGVINLQVKLDGL